MQVRNNYTPDVLDCLANLSNDEVFTPPIIVNQMLDQLPQEIFKSKDTTFLDPFTKSGVFLREITKRLLEGQIPDYKQTADEIGRITKEAIQDGVRNGVLDLEDAEYENKARDIGDTAIKKHPEANKYLNFEIDLQDALDHILTKQVFGIAITELTSQLARRSLYCSKDASGHYSVCSAFGANGEGNIRFVPMKHKWNKMVNKNGTFPKGTFCEYCGASVESLDRPDDYESHAYEFIHIDNPKEIYNMEFTVVCGNPPYQLNDGGGNGASAKPIYHLFVETAKKLNPKYITMITPSRWFAGGKGLDEYRDTMLHDERLHIIHDFPETGDCFTGVSIKGGVSYFLWERDYKGQCDVYSHKGNNISGPVTRPLLEEGCDTFIRYNEAVDILRKISRFGEKSFMDLVSSRMPFGLPNTYKGLKTPTSKDDYKIYVSGNDREIRGTVAYAPKSDVTKGHELIDCHKVYISKAGSGSDVFPHSILTRPFYGEPNTICNESYLVIGPFKDKNVCDNVISYIHTRFFRFMVLIKKTSQNAAKGVYQLVPQQDFNKYWTDEALYKKYGISQDEIDFIESMIKPME